MISRSSRLVTGLFFLLLSHCSSPPDPAVRESHYELVLANIAARQQQFQRVIDLTTVALSSGNLNDADEAVAYGMRANNEDNLGEFPLARLDIEKALLLRPNSALNYLVRSSIDIHQMQPDVAMQDAKRALALKPSSVVVDIQLADISLLLKRYQEASVYAEAAIDLEPYNAAPYSEAVRARLALRDNQKARVLIDRLERADGETAGVFLYRAWVFEAEDRLIDAERELRVAQQLDPQSKAVNVSEGHLLIHRGKYNEAIRELSGRDLQSPDDNTLLVLFVALLRANANRSAYHKVASETVSKLWPLPIVAYLDGQIDEHTLDSKQPLADDSLVNDRCFRNFFVGEKALSEGRRTDAEPMLALAKDTCPVFGFEQHQAKIDLASLAIQTISRQAH